MSSPLCYFSCAACQKIITDSHFLMAIGLAWHENCLRCTCCNSQLTDYGDRFYARLGLLLCTIDYVRIFGLFGLCCLCLRPIEPSAWAMSIGNGPRFSHLNCFRCWKCGYRFCVGEKYHLVDGLVVCDCDLVNLAPIRSL